MKKQFFGILALGFVALAVGCNQPTIPDNYQPTDEIVAYQSPVNQPDEVTAQATGEKATVRSVVPWGKNIPAGDVPWLSVAFNQTMNKASLKITVTPEVKVAAAWWPNETYVRYTLTEPLKSGTTYTVKVSGKDKDGNALAGNLTSWSFSTKAVANLLGRVVSVKSIGFSNGVNTFDFYSSLPDGSNSQKLFSYTNSSGFPETPGCTSVSPDGMKIAFVPNGGGRTNLPTTILFNLNGSVLGTTIMTSGCPTWSPDGKSILSKSYTEAINDCSRDLLSILNGTDLSFITLIVQTDSCRDPNAKVYRLSDGAWSPDSKSVAYASNLGVFTMDIATGTTTKISDFTDVTAVSWAPNPTVTFTRP